MKRESTGIEPFVGLIVSTYDQNLSTSDSHHQWFHVKAFTDNTGHNKSVAYLPLLLDVFYFSYKKNDDRVNRYFSDGSHLQSIFESIFYEEVEEVEGGKNMNIFSIQEELIIESETMQGK